MEITPVAFSAEDFSIIMKLDNCSSKVCLKKLRQKPTEYFISDSCVLIVYVQL